MELISILVIILILAFIGGGAFLILQGFTTGRKTETIINNWPSVSAQVLSSEVVESSGFDEKGEQVAEFKPAVRLSYQIDGKDYTSIQIGPAVRAENAESARRIANQYHAGSKVTIHYDPEHPTETMPTARPPLVKSVIIAGSVLVLIGISTGCIGFIAFLIYFFTH
jgi:hypothetical protein